MPKRFADRDQTKCSSQDCNFKSGQTVLKSCGKQAILEKEISYTKTPRSKVTVQIYDMLPRTFFMLPRVSRRLKRSALRYLTEFVKYFPNASRYLNAGN